MPDYSIESISAYDARFPLPEGAGTDSVHTNSEYSLGVTLLESQNGLCGSGITLTLGEGNRLVCEAIGEIELEDNILVIRRIHVRLKLRAEERHWETARRVHGFFADKCPVYRSLKAAIAISTELIVDSFSELACE